MISTLRDADGIAVPRSQTKNYRPQVAALCFRDNGTQKEVLLITSRDTGRWIIPKGWPMAGKDDRHAAIQEAWEEAGVRAVASEAPAVGTYTYDKRMDDGASVPVEATVYPVRVARLEERFPEAAQRERKWVTPSQAANMVQEPELQDILRRV